MSNTVVLPKPTTEIKRSGSGLQIFAGVFIMSLASLLLELAVTRLFSVILFYHFAFLAISVALLGLGAGGVFAYIRKDWLSRWDTHTLGARICAIDSVAILTVLLIVIRIPVSLRLTPGNFINLTILYLVSAVPFFFTGLLFSVVFAREARRIGPLYGADLVGGAAACLTVVPLLNNVGGPNTILCAALAMALASVIWASTTRGRAIAWTLLVLMAALLGVNRSGKVIDIIYAKGVPRVGQSILFARWNAISRIEVDQQGDSKWITIDADASTIITNVDPHKWQGTPWETTLMASSPSVANVLRPKGEFAIIGPGGGVDVLRAVANGSPSVTGIEINPLIANTVMRDKYADYAYHLYEIPEVHMHVNDGRSWIRNSTQRFDVLQMTLVDTWASTAAGAFALSENSLYTVQAFREYFDHLKPDGMIAITRWEFKRPREALRVVSVAMAALHNIGVKEPAGNFMVISQGPLDNDGIPVTVLAKKTPFTAEEESAVREHLAKNNNLAVLYMPSQPGSNPYSQLIASGDPVGFSRHYDFNVSPVTDNAPFFFFTMKLGDIFNRGLSKGIDWKVNVGVAVLLMLFVISVLAVRIFLTLPLKLAGVIKPDRKPLYYFIMIGLGYILVEIAFIQRFVLFLGHPTYALTVVVFLMLLSSGAGSLISRRWLPDPVKVRIPLVALVVALLIYLFLLPVMLTQFVGLPFAAKLAMSAVLLVPLGFAMGMPFPSGLRALHGAGENTVEWAWAMNAASSVLGSVVAMLIAIQFGLGATLACGAAAYLLAAMLTSTFKTQLEKS